MLFLKARSRQTFVINVEGVHIIKLKVWSISRGKVELAFEAPPEVTIRREELVASNQPMKARPE